LAVSYDTAIKKILMAIAAREHKKRLVSLHLDFLLLGFFGSGFTLKKAETTCSKVNGDNDSRLFVFFFSVI